MQPHVITLPALRGWCDEVRHSRVVAVERNALLALADLLQSEMESANEHYSRGVFDPAKAPFIEVEETCRGSCAMIQYNTTKRKIKTLGDQYQKQLRGWIEQYATRFGFTLPLRFVP